MKVKAYLGARYVLEEVVGDTLEGLLRSGSPGLELYKRLAAEIIDDEKFFERVKDRHLREVKELRVYAKHKRNKVRAT